VNKVYIWLQLCTPPNLGDAYCFCHVHQSVSPSVRPSVSQSVHYFTNHLSQRLLTLNQYLSALVKEREGRGLDVLLQYSENNLTGQCLSNILRTQNPPSKSQDPLKQSVLSAQGWTHSITAGGQIKPVAQSASVIQPSVKVKQCMSLWWLCVRSLNAVTWVLC